MPAVKLNGEPVDLPDTATAADAVRARGLEGEARGVAVAVDGEVVPRGEWERVRLGEGANVEVLQAVQGG